MLLSGAMWYKRSLSSEHDAASGVPTVYQSLLDTPIQQARARNEAFTASFPSPSQMAPHSASIRLARAIPEQPVRETSIPSPAATPSLATRLRKRKARSLDLVAHTGFVTDRSLNTVALVYKKWHQGIDGKMSVVALNEQYGNTWVSLEGGHRRSRNARHDLIDMVEDVAQGMSISPEQAISQSAEIKDTASLNALRKRMK